VTRPHRRRPSAERIKTTTVSVTCLTDGHAHHVPDTELVVTTIRRPGVYLALCGHLVTAASMVEPGGKPCRLCDAL